MYLKNYILICAANHFSPASIPRVLSGKKASTSRLRRRNQQIHPHWLMLSGGDYLSQLHVASEIRHTAWQGAAKSIA